MSWDAEISVKNALESLKKDLEKAQGFQAEITDIVVKIQNAMSALEFLRQYDKVVNFEGVSARLEYFKKRHDKKETF
jgi:hypothetical protein